MASAEQGRKALDEAIARKARVFTPTDRLANVEELWDQGLPPGFQTGWPSVDKHYTVAPGQLTIITGWPGSGKSEWLDALLVNLGRQGWRHAIFSPENQPLELHIAKLLEKISGRPFGSGPQPRIERSKISGWMTELSKVFTFMEPPVDALQAIEVIEAANAIFAGHDGPKALVIDPWNELEHSRPGNLSETEYISQTLSMLRNWARKRCVHVFLVAHPFKARREDGKLPIPRPDMISGSQHWWNKADACLTVYRDLEKLESREVQIYVQKVRFKHIGKPGLVTLEYDRVTGRYSEPSVLAERTYREAM